MRQAPGNLPDQFATDRLGQIVIALGYHDQSAKPADDAFLQNTSGMRVPDRNIGEPISPSKRGLIAAFETFEYLECPASNASPSEMPAGKPRAFHR